MIGLGSEDVRLGDTVHVLFGGKVPFLLRRVEAGQDLGQGTHLSRFQYVCDAFVHGIMDGEGLNMGERQTITII